MNLINETIMTSISISAGVDFNLVRTSTLEFIRKINLKFSTGSVQRLDSIKHIIALELACRHHHHPFSRNLLIKRSGLKESEYQSLVNLVKTALHLNQTKTNVIDTLSIQFGATHKSYACELMEQYESSLVLMNNNVTKNCPVHQAAAFYLSLKLRKVPVDKERIVRAAEVDRGHFNRTCDALMKVVRLSPSSSSNMNHKNHQSVVMNKPTSVHADLKPSSSSVSTPSITSGSDFLPLHRYLHQGIPSYSNKADPIIGSSSINEDVNMNEMIEKDENIDPQKPNSLTTLKTLYSNPILKSSLSLFETHLLINPLKTDEKVIKPKPLKNSFNLQESEVFKHDEDNRKKYLLLRDEYLNRKRQKQSRESTDISTESVEADISQVND